jgi:hypothetical protein
MEAQLEGPEKVQALLALRGLLAFELLFHVLQVMLMLD